MLLTEAYKNQLVEKHAKKPWGGGGASWVPIIGSFVAMEMLDSALDYGCGRHTFKNAMSTHYPHVDVREYDPGLPGFDQAPEPAQLVVCTDVLEHFEPTHVDAGLVHLRDLTQKVLFLVIACQASKSFLPDGRNTHLTIQPAKWWKHELTKYFGQQFRWKTIEETKGRLVLCLWRKAE